MAAFTPNLDAYFGRIGYLGPRAASLELLREIQRLHSSVIPFENLDVIAGGPIPLDGPAVERKLIHARRGGYCFEQNGYLLRVLRALGFAVQPYLARVRWNLPAGVTLPCTHLVLRVEAAGRPWLCDVGFGGVGMTEIVGWEVAAEARADEGGRRMQFNRHRRVHQLRVGATWSDIYEIAAEEALPVDWEMANWYTSTHPQSRFRQNLIAARSPPQGRCSLLNREFTCRGVGGVERRVLEGPEELLVCLHEHFGLTFPAGTRFGAPGVPWPA